ncbi:hypothetical protein GCM10027271_20920 [Saccharopolyspora gloriosae]
MRRRAKWNEYGRCPTGKNGDTGPRPRHAPNAPRPRTDRDQYSRRSRLNHRSPDRGERAHRAPTAAVASALVPVYRTTDGIFQSRSGEPAAERVELLGLEPR